MANFDLIKLAVMIKKHFPQYIWVKYAEWI